MFSIEAIEGQGPDGSLGKRIEHLLQQRGATGQKYRGTTQVKSIGYTIHQQLVLTDSTFIYFCKDWVGIGKGMLRKEYCNCNFFSVIEITEYLKREGRRPDCRIRDVEGFCILLCGIERCVGSFQFVNTNKSVSECRSFKGIVHLPSCHSKLPSVGHKLRYLKSVFSSIHRTWFDVIWVFSI